MKKITILLVFVFTSVIVNATNEEDAKSENTAMKTTSISGKVMDKITGEVLAGVKVSLNGADQCVYTDFDGNFEFKGIKEGEVEIKASYISYKNKTEKVNVCLSKSNQVEVEIESLTE